jgi:hypothetical protein
MALALLSRFDQINLTKDKHSSLFRSRVGDTVKKFKISTLGKKMKKNPGHCSNLTLAQ